MSYEMFCTNVNNWQQCILVPELKNKQMRRLDSSKLSPEASQTEGPGFKPIRALIVMRKF